MLVPFRWTLLYFVTMHSTWLRDLYRWCSVIEFFGPALLHSIIAQKERFVKYRIALHGKGWTVRITEIEFKNRMFEEV